MTQGPGQRPSPDANGGVGPNGRFVYPDSTPDERTFALLMHLSVLGQWVIPPFAIIAPIVMWQMKKDESPFIDEHGREVVNFQISLLLYAAVFFVLGFVTCGVAFGLVALVYVLGLVGMILGAIASNRGESFRYPMTLRFLN